MLSLLISAIVVLLVAFFGDVIRKPERSVYLFAVGSIAFPKNWEIDLGLGEPVLLARAIQLMLFAIVLLAILVHRDRWPRLRFHPGLFKFLVAFAAVILFGTFVPLGLSAAGIRSRPIEISLIRQSFLATHYLFALALLAAAMLFLDTLERMETFLKCIALCGIFGLLDFFVFYVLDLSPEAREQMSAGGGGLGVLFLGGHDAVGRLAVMITFAAAYFIVFRSSASHYILAFAGLLLMLASGSRPVMISGLAALLLYWWLRRQQLRREPRVPFLASLLLLLAIFVPWGIYAFQAQDAAIRSVELVSQRQDYFEAEVGIVERLAIWARGIDVFIATMPFGTGGGLLPFYMSGAAGASIPSHFSPAGLGGQLYARFAGEIISVHNLYLEFIAENGLGGILLTVWYGLLCWRSFKTFRRLGRSLDEQRRQMLIAVLCILFAAALNVVTDATFKAYWLYAIFLALVVALPVVSGQSEPAPAAAENNS